MNAPEGVRRICLVIRWFGKGIAALCVAASFWVFFDKSLEDAAGVVISGLAFWGVCNLTSWVLLGFVEPKP